MPSDCLFCRIVAAEVPSTQVHSDELVVAIRDISPKAPTHLLLLSREHITSAAEIGEGQGALLERIFDVARRLAADEGVVESGYRLVTNVGRDAGQSVAHLHVHLLGGRALGWPPG